MLLIVGGSRDINIARLADAAAARGYPHRVFLTDAVPPPSVVWQPGRSEISINGETFNAANTSLFIRYDMFGDSPEESRAAFFDTIKGWAATYPSVGLLNRGNENLEMNKPRALVEAALCGFDVPETYVTSDFNSFADRGAYIVKPVSGGAYTRPLAEAENRDGHPWIVQQKLGYPELRLFRVGKYYFAFAIDSALLDYRIDQDVTIREVTPPADLVAALQALSDRMGLNYAAADLKTDPVTGQLKFLEINSMPMFSGYDDCTGGRLSDALFLTLRGLMPTAMKSQPKLHL